MTAEQQLERSVLEGKERDELSAIAQAMSLKTTTRTKKADIIDQILDATGVTSGSAPAASSNGDDGTNGTKPARRSRASAAARGAADAASFVSGDGAADSAATADAGDAPAVEAAPATRHLLPTRRATATPGRPSSWSPPSCPTAPIPHPGRTGSTRATPTRTTGAGVSRATATRTGTRATRTGTRTTRTPGQPGQPVRR